jgi:hypothetical protein
VDEEFNMKNQEDGGEENENWKLHRTKEDIVVQTSGNKSHLPLSHIY